MKKNREMRRHGSKGISSRAVVHGTSRSAQYSSGETMNRPDDYGDFLKDKKLVFKNEGRKISLSGINPVLFPFQRALVKWACGKGRACIFADCGLGKTVMQLEWARIMGSKSLIVAPLAVTAQTIKEADRLLNMKIEYITEPSAIDRPGIWITNYERLRAFVGYKELDAIVLDESSILKSLDGKTRTMLIEDFQGVPFRLCCTATPCPNDIAELANHAAFLGIMSRAEMLATFFVHDDNGWRLRGYAESALWGWLVSWGCYLRMPSDIGFDDNGFKLRPLKIGESIVKTEFRQPGELFVMPPKGIGGRNKARRGTLQERIDRAVRLIGEEQDQQFIAWVGLNDEGRELYGALKSEAVLVEGQDELEEKIEKFNQFTTGQKRILITKPKIAQFGMNFQNCARMIFVGLGDSYESYYQCLRRCWRFGQKRPVIATIVLSDAEEAVLTNVKRKEGDAAKMINGMINNMKDLEVAEIKATEKEQEAYSEKEETGSRWKMQKGDCVELMSKAGGDCIDLSVYSPPFIDLYTYTASDRDIGNSKDEKTFFAHYGFFAKELLRLTKPGRNTCCHVSQVPALLVKDGFIGMKDFRGKIIEIYIKAGWIYHGEVCIDKDPQAQAIRTHSKGLLFIQMKKDASWLRPALADYILVFRKPGENGAPIKPDLTNDQWIEWARPIWYGINASDTLSRVEARSGNDDKHICPLQLGVIERCVRLWSNLGELVLSPFAGIGSEGHVAIEQGRRFWGIELKEEYFNVAIKNLKRAREREKQQAFDFAPIS